jgi:hypothetical protein
VNRTRRAAEVLGVRLPHNMKDKLVKIVTITVAASGMLLNSGFANAAVLTNAKVALTDPRPSAVTSYTFTGSTVTTSLAVHCIKVTFSSASASVVTPSGFTAAAATVNAGSTLINSSTTGWANTTPTANTITYINATGVTPLSATSTFILDNVTSSSTADTGYFYKLSTFSNGDCATGPIDNAAVQFINTNGSTLSLTVDNTLSFTVNAVASGGACAGVTSNATTTSTTIPFGTVTAATNGLACQNLTAATNATNGYTIYIRETGPLTNGIAQTFADWTGTNITPTTFTAPGTEAYGYSTNDITLGTGTTGRFSGNKFAANTTTNAEIAYEAAGLTSTTYSVAHQAAVSLTTKPGSYQTTVIYTCTPVY